MNRFFSIVMFFLISTSTFSQENLFAIFPDSIKEYANAVVKNDISDVEISSFNSLSIKKSRTITILNEAGLKNMDAYEHFDKSTSVNFIEATIYNSFGVEVKKFKKKDFKENSVSEGSIITDNKVLFLDYTPTQYPFTLVYKSEITTSNTAFIPSWSPIEEYYVSVLNSSIRVNHAVDVKLKYKEFNFDNTIVKNVTPGSVTYTVKNVKALKREEMAPSLRKTVPYVMFGLNKFEIEGVVGYADNWEVFGKWVHDKLLSDTEEIEEQTIVYLTKLIGSETSNLKKAKIIYEYVQNKTRYVSIQLGIGGWKPMLAKDVDRLGYGDCKALTNYTRSLLKAFKVPSYYAIVYGDEEKRDLQEEFVSMQGNHVILGVPDSDNIVWLECTSQVQPFGFQGDFTDDRKVLIIGENNSKIIKTKAYINDQNYQNTISKVILHDDNSINCDVEIKSKGIIYNDKLSLKPENKASLISYYNDFFGIINNKVFVKTEVFNNKENLELKELINFTAKDFVKNNNGKIILPINCINQVSFVPKKYDKRKESFEIERGYYLEDKIVVELQNKFEIESLPKNLIIKNEFGEYDYKVELLNNSIHLTRKLLIRQGLYSPEKYESYRKFREQVARNENNKILLIKL